MLWAYYALVCLLPKTFYHLLTINEELKDLLAAWSGVELAPERRDELLARLRDDAEFRETVASDIALLGQIRAVQAPEPRWIALDEILGKRRSEVVDFEQDTMNRIHQISRSHQPMKWLAIAAALALLAALVMTLPKLQNSKLANHGSTPPTQEIVKSPLGTTEVAIITLSDMAIGPAGAIYQRGDRMYPGILKIDTGVLQMRFLSGATVTLQGPAEMDLRSEKAAAVLMGLVVADVPPVAQGFTLVSGGWRAVDRGTVFGIDARNPDHTEVHVLKGKVDMHRGDQAALDMTLTTGQAMRIDSGVKSSIMPANSLEFPDTRALAKRTTEQSRSRFESWKESSDALAKDDSLALYYDFEAADRESDVIFNRAPGAETASDGTLIGGEWVEGRWAGKHAVRFNRVGDLIRSRPNSRLDAATFMIWVRMDNPNPNSFSPFLLSPQVGPGHVYWMAWPTYISHADKPWVTFVKTTMDMKDLHYWESQSLEKPVQGLWKQFAVVNDPAKDQVRLYTDGSLVATKTMRDQTQINLDEIVMGNWGYTSESRNFIGLIDELAIFGRALTDEEISKYYETGRP